MKALHCEIRLTTEFSRRLVLRTIYVFSMTSGYFKREAASADTGDSMVVRRLESLQISS